MHLSESVRFSRQNLLTGVAVLTICAFAFGVRVINWNDVFVGDEVRCIENDAYYHMRRVFLAVENRLQVPAYDSYMNFPDGLYCNWPPLFDWLIAGTALLLGCGHPSANLIDTVGAFVPPVLGALTVLVVYLIGAFCFGRKPALLTAFVFALLPYHIQVSVLGRPDHHVAVVLLSSLLFLSIMHLAAAQRRCHMFELSLIGGFLLFANLATWIGSLLFVGVLLGFFSILIFLNRCDEKRLVSLTVAGAGIFACAALFLWPLVSRTHWWLTNQPTWSALSSCHLAVLCCCALALLIEMAAIRLTLMTKSSSSNARWKYGVTILALSAAAILLARNSIIESLLDAPRWFLKQDPLMRQVYESNPLTLRSAMENFTGLAVLLPVILLMMCWRWWKNDRKELLALFPLWTIAAGISAVIQERFSDIFSVNAAILIGGLSAIALAVERQPPSSPMPLPTRARIPIVAVLLIVYALASWPTLKWLKSYWINARSPQTQRTIVYEMCHWLRDNTPAQPGYDLKGGGKPDYSVLAGWPLGNAITYLGHRANVANNFVGWKESREANQIPYRFFVSTNVVEAENMLAACSTCYVIVEEPISSGYLALMLDALGLNHADFFNEKIAEAGSVFSPKRRALDCMITRLYLSTGEQLGHFRLVYESKQKAAAAGRSISMLRIFEYVGGAGNSAL
jgi:dolichyl-phosphooligosaccharide-protein glycotransferase